MKSQTLWLLVAQVSCMMLRQLPSLLGFFCLVKTRASKQWPGLGRRMSIAEARWISRTIFKFRKKLQSLFCLKLQLSQSTLHLEEIATDACVEKQNIVLPY